MIKIEKVSYKALKRVSVMDRLKLANDPGIGNTLMSALTPTQMAELFPSYYRQGLPDVSGFQKAIPSAMTQAKQQWYEEQVQGAVKGDKAGAVLQPTLKKNESTWEKVKRKASEAMGIPSGKGKPLPPAQLTATQRAAIEDLKKGAIAVDDPRVKFMAGLTNEQLVKTGIQRAKDQGGKEVFQYTAPTVSEEEAKKSLAQSSGGPGTNIAQRLAFYRQYAKSKGLNPDFVTGIVMREGGQTKNRMQRWANNDPSLSGQPGTAYGDFQLNVGSTVHRMGNDFQRAHPNVPMDSAHWKEQGMFAIDQIAAGRSREWMSIKNNGGADAITRIGASEWKQREASATVTTDPLTGNFTDTQIAAEQKRLQQEQEMGRLGSLAEFTTATPQQLTRDPHITSSGSTDFGSLSQQATKIGQITHPGFQIRNDGKGGMCGVGAHSFAGAMFGAEHFNKGLGGNAHTLSTGNNYFQSSGLYSNPTSPKGDLTDKAYLDSLPVGTVISAEGGGRGLGHVQIKTGPGQWASDFGQGNKVLLQSHGVAYYNQQVHLPNERGQQLLASRGFPVTSLPAAVKSEATDPTPPGVETIQSVSTPQQQVLTRDPHIIQPQATTAAPVKQSPEPTKQTQPEKPKGPTGGAYRVNMKAFREAVKNDPSNSYPGWMIDMASDQDIIDGFNKDARVKAAGVNIGSDGRMTVKDIHHPDVKNVLESAQKGGALKQIEEEKKAKETKPGEVKPVATAPAAPAPQATSKAPDSPPTASVSAAPATPSTEIKQSSEGKGEGSRGGFDIDRAMALIRRQESGSFGGNYSADAALKTKGKMTASGAYQFNNKTWGAVTKQFNIGTEYKRAVDAPKDVQDAVMRARVEDLYKKHGSIEKVLMTHFTGNAAGKMSAKAIKANGGLTGPQYVASIIKEHGPAYDKTLNPDVKPTQTVSTPGSADVQAPIEKASYTPSQQGPSVSPQAKTSTGPVGPAISPEMGGVRKDIHALRDEMNNKFGEIQQSSQIQPSHFKRTISDNNANMMNELKTATAKEYSNPTAERALGSRPHFAETGGATAHYSGGNNVG